MAQAKTRRRLPPPALFAISWGVQRLLTRGRRATPASRTAFGVVVAGSGALAVTAVGSLFASDTAVSPEDPGKATTLVTDGPFRFTRNPVYLALTGLLVGHALLKRSALALGPAAGFAAALNNDQIPSEERALRKRFGRKYERYERETPRWVGRCPRRSA